MAVTPTFLTFLLLNAVAAAFHATTADADVSFSYAQADKTLPPTLVRRNSADDPKPDGTVWLIRPANEQKPNQIVQKPGWLLYDSPSTWETNTSFSTAFQFQFITSLNRSGDSIAFFFSRHNSLQNHTSVLFLPSDPFFAAVIDTNNSHAGFDINSFDSYPTVDIGASSPHPDLDLYQNSSFMVWVDYYAATTSIELRMLNIDNMTLDTISRPLDPHLSLIHNLSTVFRSTALFVGLSATTGDGSRSQSCAVRFWNFTLSMPYLLESDSSSTTNTNDNPDMLNSPQAVLNSPQIPRSVNYIKPILVSSILAVAFFVAVATAIIAYWKGCCCSTDDDQNIELALIPHDMLVVALEPTRPPYPGASW